MTLYNAKELEQQAGLDSGTIRNLVMKGLPVNSKRKSRHGKPENMYDALAVFKWFVCQYILRKLPQSGHAVIVNMGNLAGIKSMDADTKERLIDDLDKQLRFIFKQKRCTIF